MSASQMLIEFWVWEFLMVLSTYFSIWPFDDQLGTPEIKLKYVFIITEPSYNDLYKPHQMSSDKYNLSEGRKLPPDSDMTLPRDRTAVLSLAANFMHPSWATSFYPD